MSNSPSKGPLRLRAGDTLDGLRIVHIGNVSSAHVDPKPSTEQLHHRQVPLELLRPVLVRIPWHASSEMRRLPCGSSVVSAMRVHTYYEPDVMTLPAEVLAERDEVRRAQRARESPVRAFVLEVALRFYDSLVSSNRRQKVRRYDKVGIDQLACPSAGLRAWRLAVVLLERCARLPWPRDENGRLLLPLRLRERGVPYVETPSYLLVAKQWVDSPQVQAALAEARGAHGAAMTERDREKRLAKVRAMRNRRKRRG